VTYVHDDSGSDSDRLIYGVGLIYGRQLELDAPLSRRYFGGVAALPVIVQQVLPHQDDFLNMHQLSQMDPRDALPRAHRAVQRGGRSV